MSGPFQRTVVLNVSSFPSSASRVDIAKCMNAKFESHFPVDSIQFVPGGNVQVTFRDSHAKRSVESVESIAIGSVQCRVVKPGPRMENVLVFHYPFESSPSALRMALSSFGEVHEVSMQHYPDLNTVSTGTRLVRMVRKASIPRSLDINGCVVKVWYRGQLVECDICGKSGHVSKVCPLKGKCRRCLQPGHLARNCMNAPRAWDSVPSSGDAVPSSGSSVASQDPTPAEAAAVSVPARPPDVPAASASSAPAPSFAIGVYGADENWGMDDGKMEVGNGDATSDCDEDSVGVDGGESGVNGDGVADVGDPEASQSVLAGVSTVVDPPVSARPSIDVIEKPSGGVAGSASADVNVSVGKESQVQCQSSVDESLQDAQVVNTPLSGPQVVLSDPVVTVLEEGVVVPENVRLIPRDPFYRRNKVLRVDWSKRMVFVKAGVGGGVWVEGMVNRPVHGRR